MKKAHNQMLIKKFLCDEVLHYEALQNFKCQDRKVMICEFHFFQARASRSLS